MKIRSVLIANRGEIALRIMRTLNRMNIKSVSLYTDIESEDTHVKMADTSCYLGNGSMEETWLNIEHIIDIARKTGVDAIHPGYGFLSENADFARACENEGILFIGPDSQAIEAMGSKITAAQYAAQANIPMLPRMQGNHDELIANGHTLGFPLLVKAASGGGGKGMIRVDDITMLAPAVKSAVAQAQRYFSNDEVYLEKYIVNPRHIEVQILADHYGNIIHLFERECTLQRNHQKVVEEAPSASITDEIRQKLFSYAINLARIVGYTNAGTVEFILDEEMNFYFLEMNTRIQVEHPVTEMITGIDIVEHQIRIAQGEKLSLTQDRISINGHAIEARLYAEDPAKNYAPSAGFIKKLYIPSGKNIRIDSAIDGSGRVHPFFDAMISKIIVHANDRSKALSLLQSTLSKSMVHGIRTNLILLSNITIDPLFEKNQLTTHTIKDNLAKWSKNTYDLNMIPVVAALFLWIEKYSNWNKPWRMAGNTMIRINNMEYPVFYHPVGEGGMRIKIHDRSEFIEEIKAEEGKIHAKWNNTLHTFVCSIAAGDVLLQQSGNCYHIIAPEVLPLPKTHFNGHETKVVDLKASLFGKVLRINVIDKQKVSMGDPLIVLESMKMENTILAPGDRIVSRINVKEGDQVIDGQSLILFEP